MTKPASVIVTPSEATKLVFLSRHPGYPDNQGIVEKVIKSLSSKTLPKDVSFLPDQVKKQLAARKRLANYVRTELSAPETTRVTTKTVPKMRASKANL